MRGIDRFAGRAIVAIDEVRASVSNGDERVTTGSADDARLVTRVERACVGVGRDPPTISARRARVVVHLALRIQPVQESGIV